MIPIRVLSAPVLAGALVLAVVAAPAPARAETLPGARAASLAERLAGVRVLTPDGRRVLALDPDGGDAVLDVDRLATCLATVAESGADRDVWVVVQDEGVAWDLVFRLTSGEAGGDAVDDVVALARQDWDPETLRAALRERLGRRPGKVRDVVVQGFSRRVVTTYPYEPGPAEGRSGLVALLPEDAVLREARSVDLGDGRRHTFALVLREATFEPVDCDTAVGRARGHVDRGRVWAILAGPDGIEDEIDLTPFLSNGGVAFLPRYRCAPGESSATLGPERVRDWIRSRDPVPLIDWVDADGDGRSLEVRLPIVVGAGGEIVVAVDPDSTTLDVAP